MAEKKHKPAVPLSVAVKWIVKDRDKYKEKLEQLIPYTKQLESGRSQRIEELQNEVLRLKNRLEKKNRDYEALMAENTALRRGYQDSEWYRSLQENNKQLRQTITNLRKALNRALCENINKDANLGG